MFVSAQRSPIFWKQGRRYSGRRKRQSRFDDDRIALRFSVFQREYSGQPEAL